MERVITSDSNMFDERVIEHDSIIESRTSHLEPEFHSSNSETTIMDDSNKRNSEPLRPESTNLLERVTLV